MNDATDTSEILNSDYYRSFDFRAPPEFPAPTKATMFKWHLLASITLGFSVWYLHWRWTSSLNWDAAVFSVLIVSAETLMFFGTCLFFYDMWDAKDTERKPAESLTKRYVSDVCVDIFITTFDEDTDMVQKSVQAARQVAVPQHVRVKIHVLDDGDRADMKRMSHFENVNYVTRQNNLGFKAGNLKNALFQTESDFFVICDADTVLFPSFLENTLGYFSDENVAWVQTPHWFYDIPTHPTLWGKIRSLIGPMKSSKITAYLKDPFACEPDVFFDVIQRRRNRNGASFCCGAASIHRREAVFETTLQSNQDRRQRQTLFNRVEQDACFHMSKGQMLQPFRFHVSEDILTSIDIHSHADKRWKSVYHPRVEAKMLSPWSLEAWGIQRSKYARGTYDIILNHNPLFKRGMPWRIKLHYAATFYSYLAIFWMPILFFSPIFTLFTGIAPVDTYSLQFFIHLMPVLLLSELALIFGCNGHNISKGRVLSLVSFPLHIASFFHVAVGSRMSFRSTPKTVKKSGQMRFIWPHLLLVITMLMAVVYGSYAVWAGYENYSTALLLVNLFWIFWSLKPLLNFLNAWLFDPTVAIKAVERERQDLAI